MSMLDGVTVPVVTPLDDELRPVAKLAFAHLDALADSGVVHVMFFGTNGEGALLNPHHSGDFLLEAIPYWRDRVGPSATATATAFGAGTRESLNRARIFAEARPDAIVVPPPNYFVHTHRELVAHFAAFDQLGLPVVAYNAPRYTGNPITPVLADALAAMPHLHGIKDSGGDAELLLHSIRLRDEGREFAVSQGDERRLGWAIMAGADGVTPGLANLAPLDCLAIVAAARQGNAALSDEIQERLDRLAAIHGVRPGVAAMKAALFARGLTPRATSQPIEPFDDQELTRLREVLTSWEGRLIGAESLP